MIIERCRRRGYQLHAQGSPEAEALLSERGLTRADLDRAIAGALKKKLALNVEATRTREVGPNKVGAKGSTTVYRIVG